jgi:hypothetical protein
LADRLKHHLPHIIHPTQAAFIQGCHIASNIIIAQEMVHSFNLKTWNHKAFLLKLDLAKAFDRIEWHFIVLALRRQGFQDRFIDLVFACISTTSLSILINGDSTAAILPQWGIRQGCPLSPYLFVLALNELSIHLQNTIHDNNIQGISLGPNSPQIHSLLFADDLIICGQANGVEANTINNILQNFCLAFGQTPNLSKSAILFSKHVDAHNKQAVKNIFPIPNLDPNTIHLGHLLIFNHCDRSKAYEFILNKFRAKLTTVKANKLNHAGRLTYIKSVLTSIPIYYMSTVLFSKTFIEKITTIIQRFWWARVQEDSHSSPFHFKSWDDICQSNDNGGLAIRDSL